MKKTTLGLPPKIPSRKKNIKDKSVMLLGFQPPLPPTDEEIEPEKRVFDLQSDEKHLKKHLVDIDFLDLNLSGNYAEQK
jgi:hypothetical protein